MCTRFVWHGTHMMVGFNFDIDLSVPSVDKGMEP